MGTNVRIDILRVTQGSDDVVGGAVTTEAIVYEDVRARLSAPGSGGLTEAIQGLEAPQDYRFILYRSPLALSIDDIIVLRAGAYKNERFLVETIREGSPLLGRRHHIQVSARHVEQARDF